MAIPTLKEKIREDLEDLPFGMKDASSWDDTFVDLGATGAGRWELNVILQSMMESFDNFRSNQVIMVDLVIYSMVLSSMARGFTGS